jgi:uncharacterized protein
VLFCVGKERPGFRETPEGGNVTAFREKVVNGQAVEERLPLLVESLSAFPEVAAVYLFGSFARGKPGKMSDVDVAVLTGGGEEETGSPRHLDYIVAASKALGTDRLDLVILDSAPLALRHAVFRDGELLFVRDPRVLAKFREESLRRYLDTVPLRAAYAAAFFRRIREDGFGRRNPGR